VGTHGFLRSLIIIHTINIFFFYKQQHLFSFAPIRLQHGIYCNAIAPKRPPSLASKERITLEDQKSPSLWTIRIHAFINSKPSREGHQNPVAVQPSK
jgi:hypothetical protein